MRGIIVVNAYLKPDESVRQANRMKTELENLGVEMEILNTAFLRTMIYNGEITSDLNADFVLFLDKDKYLSSELDKLGIRTFNRHSAIRTCDDKGETYLALSKSGVNIPDTVLGALSYNLDDKVNPEYADDIIANLSLPVVVKESYGSMGKGVYLAKTKEELLSIMDKVKCRPHLFQKYLASKVGEDIRVIVIGGRVVASMRRKNENDFRSNIALGGHGEKIDLPDSFKVSAEYIAMVLGLDYCGVDLLYGDNGKPYVCEVNSNAFFEGIEKVTGVNVAKAYAEYIKKTMTK